MDNACETDWIEVPIRVRYGETDRMGHAYYANYLYWFEVARGELCRTRGFTYKGLEGDGLFLPVVEVWARYRGEIEYDDEILILIRIGEMKRASIKFEYRVIHAHSRELKTEGYTWHVLMSASRKAMTIPDALRSLLSGG